jgi:eukaryotic-like serine/threonine-protein kinase
MTEETLFATALEKASPTERAAFLDEACCGDVTVRQRVEALLRSHEHAEFLQTPAVKRAGQKQDSSQSTSDGLPATLDEPAPGESPGTVIGPYKLLQQIGEGGMGTVFMAEQTYPVSRKVALKLIKAGMNTRQVIARFEAERQALALMDHVSIARVFDAGATESGLPYFVMELVRGVPITRYCDDNRLTPRERLELFVPVCQAIQHAHQKGIIHRDIKPSNVMITLYDGKPVPKVIDFGVAKATEQRLTERTLFTQYGTMVGTPEYMSPEQAEMSALGADTRSDVYSLGVLLYELLTGNTPLSHKRVREAAYGEVLRMIKEEEPPRPSTRLSDSGQALASISAQRHMEPARLMKLLRGELDWIVMKCLEKDRNRRYETANDFAADLERYLNDEPVKACPPSASYKFCKFARRNKRILATAGVIVLTLVLGTAVSTRQAIRATAAEGLAQDRLAAEREAKNATRDQLRLTEQAQEQAMHRLHDARLAQARAGSLSRRIGQRFDSLAATAQALKIARDLNLGEESLLDLRNAAIACLALPDLRLAKKWDSWPSTWSVNFDSTLERYARVDRQSVVHIQRAADDAEIYRFPGMGTGEAWASFSRDGRFLALARADSRFKVWNLAGSEPVVVFDESSVPGGFAFSPDSMRLAIGHADGSIRLYELPSGRERKRLESAPRRGAMAFRPDGRQLATSCATGIQVYDLETGRKLEDLPQPAVANSFAWHPGGKTLAVACNDSRIYLWDVGLGKQTHVLEGCRGTGLAISFDHAGLLLASAGWEGILRLWDPRTGRQLFHTPSGGYLGFSADDRLLTYDNRDGKLGLWEFAAGGEYRTLVRAAAAGKGVYHYPSIRSDGRLLAVGMADGIGLWDLHTGNELGFLDSPGTNYVLFEPSGALLTNGSAGLLRWPVQADTASPGLLRIGRSHKLSVPGPICHLARSADGRVIAVSQYQGGRVLHADRPDQPVVIGPHGDARYVAVSPDGRWVVTGAHNGTGVKVWKARSGELEMELPVDGGSQVGFSPDGRWLATNGGGLRLWTVGSWREGPRIGGGTAFAFSPDGKLLAGEMGHGTVRLVDPDTGREYARLETPNQDSAMYLNFGPDGTQLVITKGHNHAFHLWDLRAIRNQLAKTGLDWDLPPYPSMPDVNQAQPLEILVELGSPAEAARDERQIARELIEQKRRALEANPNDAEACNDLAWTYLTAPEAVRDWKAALPAAEKAVHLNPDPMYRNTLGLAYYRAGRYREAVETLEPNLKDEPDWALAYDLYFLAMSHHQLGESARARQFYDLALRWSVAHHDALNPYVVELSPIQAEASALLRVKDKQH